MIYATSDLHGYPLDKFKLMLEKVNFSKDDKLYILGDCIDRGKDGIKILKWIMAQPNVHFILGNHEAMMLESDFLFDEITDGSINRLNSDKFEVYMTWVYNGGQATLNALCAMRSKEIKYILEFLRKAPLYEILSVNGRDFILTHSGLGSFNKDKNLSEYSSRDLLWTRPNMEQRYYDNAITVFGHTPTMIYGTMYQGKAIVTDTWINIDAGVAGGMNPMLLRLDDLKEFYFTDEDLQINDSEN